MIVITENDAVELCRTVAERFGVKPASIVESSKGGWAETGAKTVVAYILWRYAKLSYPAISRLMGAPDHTTALKCCRRAKQTPVLREFAEVVAAQWEIPGDVPGQMSMFPVEENRQ